MLAMKLYISESQASVEDLSFELVERKGVGHPDTICDAIAERASQYYSRYCLEYFGRVAHHWFDKVMLIGGESDIGFEKGEIVKPYKLIFAGKGAHYYGETKIPMDDIFFKASADVLSEVLTGFVPEKHLEISNEIVDHQGAGRKNSRYRPMVSTDLIALEDKNRVSNDCNLLSGYAPLSILEQMVLYTEKYINGSIFKKKNPDTGWDVKIFGSRSMDEYKLVANIPFLSKFIKSYEHYLKRKEEVTLEIQAYLKDKFSVLPELTINPQDRNNKIYLTTLGSVADTGDVGVVGRGNRINGLITPMRSMSIEAPAGKNPLDHTGKLYGVLAQSLADDIYNILNKPVEVHIFTSKEASLNDPDEIIIRIMDYSNEKDQKIVREIIDKAINSVEEITKDLIFKGITMW